MTKKNGKAPMPSFWVALLRVHEATELMVKNNVTVGEWNERCAKEPPISWLEPPKKGAKAKKDGDE